MRRLHKRNDLFHTESQMALPATFETAIAALCTEIKSDNTHNKQKRHAVDVKDSQVKFELEKTASRFVIYYRVGDGAWLELTDQSGDLATKAARVQPEVERLWLANAFAEDGSRRSRCLNHNSLP